MSGEVSKILFIYTSPKMWSPSYSNYLTPASKVEIILGIFHNSQEEPFTVRRRSHFLQSTLGLCLYVTKPAILRSLISVEPRSLLCGCHGSYPKYTSPSNSLLCFIARSEGLNPPLVTPPSGFVPRTQRLFSSATPASHCGQAPRPPLSLSSGSSLSQGIQI